MDRDHAGKIVIRMAEHHLTELEGGLGKEHLLVPSDEIGVYEVGLALGQVLTYLVQDVGLHDVPVSFFHILC